MRIQQIYGLDGRRTLALGEDKPTGSLDFNFWPVLIMGAVGGFFGGRGAGAAGAFVGAASGSALALALGGLTSMDDKATQIARGAGVVGAGVGLFYLGRRTK